MNLEKVIAEEIAKAKEYKAQANSGWSFFPHKKLSYLECERNRYYAERHNQIAAWLRELAERRKADSCEGCMHRYGEKLNCQLCARYYRDKYVAERRTE